MVKPNQKDITHYKRYDHLSETIHHAHRYLEALQTDEFNTRLVDPECTIQYISKTLEDFVSITLQDWWKNQRQEIKEGLKKPTSRSLKLNAVYFGEFVEAIERVLTKVSPRLNLDAPDKAKLPSFDKYNPEKWYTIYLQRKYTVGNPEYSKAFTDWKNATKSPDSSLGNIYSDRNTKAHLNPNIDSVKQQARRQSGFLETCEKLIDLIYTDNELSRYIDDAVPQMVEFTHEIGLVYMGLGLLTLIETYSVKEDTTNNTQKYSPSIEERQELLDRFTIHFKKEVNQKHKDCQFDDDSDLIDILRRIDQDMGSQRMQAGDYLPFLTEYFVFFQDILKLVSTDNIHEQWSKLKDRLIRSQHIDTSNYMYFVVVHLQHTDMNPVIMDLSFKYGESDRIPTLNPTTTTIVEHWLKKYPIEDRKNWSLTHQCIKLFEQFSESTEYECYFGKDSILLFELPSLTSSLATLPWSEDRSLRRSGIPSLTTFDFKSVHSMVDPMFFDGSNKPSQALKLPQTLNGLDDHCILFPYETPEEIDDNYNPRAKVYWTLRDSYSMTDMIQCYHLYHEITVFSCQLCDQSLDSFTSVKTPLDLLTRFQEHNLKNKSNYIASTVSFREWQTGYHQTDTMQTYQD